MRLLRSSLLVAALLALPPLAQAAAPFGEWAIVGIGGDPVTGEPTLAIDGTTIGGTSGCNRYFGTAVVNGQDIAFDGVGSTRMFCVGDGLMAQESALFEALGAVRRWEAAGGEVALLDANGVPLIILMSLGSPPADGGAIVIPVPVPVDVTTLSFMCGKRAVAVDYIVAGGIALAVLHFPDELVIAANVLAASGARYAGDRYIWWSHGEGTDLYDLTGPGGDVVPVRCTPAP